MYTLQVKWMHYSMIHYNAIMYILHDNTFVINEAGHTKTVCLVSSSRHVSKEVAKDNRL